MRSPALLVCTLLLASGCASGLGAYAPGGDLGDPLETVDEGTTGGGSSSGGPTGGSSSSGGGPTGSSSSSGSSSSGSSSSGSSGSTGTQVLLSLASVDPDFGTDAGGTLVTLTGAFDASTTVEFDGQAATVLSSTATTLEVEAPPSSVSGWVDVGVRSGTQVDGLADAWQYWPDASGDTAAHGIVAYVHLAGGYWGSQTDSAYATATMTRPGTRWQWWQEYAPAMNSCVFSYAPAGQPTPLDTGATSMTFSSLAGPSFTLASGGPGPEWFSSGALQPNVQVVPGARYDLLPMPGNPDWPAFTQPDALTVPDAFTVTSPSVNGASIQTVNRTATVTWNGGTGADYLVFYVERTWLNTLTGQWETDGYVTCAVDDTGTFTIPGNTWPDWFSGDLLYFNIGRVHDDGGVLPHNDGQNDLAGVYWVVGAVESN
jgi:hypothetical protein